MEFDIKQPEHHFAMKTQYNFNDIDSPKFSNTAFFNWNDLNNRPLTINSGKPRINYQTAAHGGATRVMTKPILCSLYLPKKSKIYKQSEKLEDFPSSVMLKTNIKFPMETYANNRRYEEDLYMTRVNNNLHKRTNTTDSGRIFGSKPGPILPILKINTSKDNECRIRPCTGNIELKDIMADTVAEQIQKGRGGIRIGTAQTNNQRKVGKMKQRSMRLSTPQTSGQKRPDSRYNKKTLYAKLEHGRADSPEYRVPIISMNFTELKEKQMIPECWK